MKHPIQAVALTVAAFLVACGGGSAPQQSPPPASAGPANAVSKASFTEDDLDQFQRGFEREIAAVKAAQQQAASATDATARGRAIQAQWETATIPEGAKASGLPEPRYRELRDAVDHVFTMLDFQGKIEGPLSIDLTRADEETRERVSRDAFADLPEPSAAALRTRMNRLVPLWSEYKKRVAVAGCAASRLTRDLPAPASVFRRRSFRSRDPARIQKLLTCGGILTLHRRPVTARPFERLCFSPAKDKRTVSRGFDRDIRNAPPASLRPRLPHARQSR